jgi:hypothetical protein
VSSDAWVAASSFGQRAINCRRVEGCTQTGDGCMGGVSRVHRLSTSLEPSPHNCFRVLVGALSSGSTILTRDLELFMAAEARDAPPNIPSQPHGRCRPRRRHGLVPVRLVSVAEGGVQPCRAWIQVARRRFGYPNRRCSAHGLYDVQSVRQGACSGRQRRRCQSMVHKRRTRACA